MSDQALVRALERMEALLGAPNQVFDADTLAEWNQSFASAEAQAERGPGWAELVKRAHALSEKVQQRVVRLSQERDQLREELKIQEQGGRALKGYGAGLR